MITTPFYKKALALFTKTQESQIEKGLKKYPEPFNPHSWTPEELLNHALEETVDLTHYLVGLKDLLDVKDLEIRKLHKEIRALKRQIPYTYEPKPVRNLTEEGYLPPKAKYSDIDDEI
jgi:hypothetical protein